MITFDEQLAPMSLIDLDRLFSFAKQSSTAQFQQAAWHGSCVEIHLYEFSVASLLGLPRNQ
jgi:hypothetical protein